MLPGPNGMEDFLLHSSLELLEPLPGLMMFKTDTMAVAMEIAHIALPIMGIDTVAGTMATTTRMAVNLAGTKAAEDCNV